MNGTIKTEFFSNKALRSFSSDEFITQIRRERRSERYDLISFGGGSCPKVVGKHAAGYGWKKICFLTNGSDNGGSTYDIVEALRPQYGPTLPVGDITSALIGLLDSYQYELLNLRGWKLDPQRFSEQERQTFAQAIVNTSTFCGRLATVVEWYQRKIPSSNSELGNGGDFCRRLLELGSLVDEVGLIQPGVKGMEISNASVRHHVFNALMIKVSAYSSTHKVPNSDRFMLGLWLLKKGLGISYTVLPCSLDEQVLYAEWANGAKEVVWSTKHVQPDNSIQSRGGQVALSNSQDRVKFLENGRYASYSRFGFDPDLPMPKVYSEAKEAIGQLRSGFPILYGPSSFIASISPCLAVEEIGEELSKRSDCPKILFSNLTLNNETIGMSVSDCLDFWELNTGRTVSETVDYVVVNNDTGSSKPICDALKDRGDTPETFKFRGALVLTGEEQRTLPQRGVVVVEAPLATVNRQLMRLSSTGERQHVWVPNHDSERLMALTNVIVNEFSQKGDLQTKDWVKQIPSANGPFEATFHCP